jgi:ABC-type nitrate/sulfonate/bicarbonate transport system substrate-binding protein
MRRLLTLTATVGTAALLAGCGQVATSGAKAAKNASLVLDFTPNAIHTGIYTALADGYLRHNGVDLHVIVPGASTDAISLLVAHKVNFAILDIHDLAIADQQGKDLVGIMAIVQRPLASVIATPRFANPRDLAGQTVGVSGDPSDLAVLRSVVEGAGGDFAKLKTLTIGYDAVPDLIAGRVAAATAFWNDEGVQLAHAGKGDFHVFRVEDYGAPPYPELVLTAPAAELKSDPSLARAVVGALVHGYQSVLRDPRAGAQALESQASGLVPSQVSQQLAVELPAFKPVGGGTVGELVPSILSAWARWELKFGIVSNLPNVSADFTNKFQP